MSTPPPYSTVERLLHKVAFSALSVQLSAADVERAMYGKQFASLPVVQPIFVTSLPRAGTTLLLERLAALPSLASQTYRDMPFVLAPVLWQHLSGSFRVGHAKAERAHGDGMQVDVDSPEAFEEVAWRAFFPEKYSATRIALWQATDTGDDGFPEFFRSLMQRVIAVRSIVAPTKTRYVAKNNANVARLPLLRRLHPDGRIVVPFRDPVAQASSLLSQHTRFLAMHREHEFTRRYMSDIGHFEFGALHRPIAFAGVDEVCARYAPDTLEYWIAYWLHGFRHVLAYAEDLQFVSYERLCAGGKGAFATVARALEVHDDASAEVADLWDPRSYDDRRARIADRDLLAAADAVHASLLQRSLV